MRTAWALVALTVLTLVASPLRAVEPGKCVDFVTTETPRRTFGSTVVNSESPEAVEYPADRAPVFVLGSVKLVNLCGRRCRTFAESPEVVVPIAKWSDDACRWKAVVAYDVLREVPWGGELSRHAAPGFSVAEDLSGDHGFYAVMLTAECGPPKARTTCTFTYGLLSRSPKLSGLAPVKGVPIMPASRLRRLGKLVLPCAVREAEEGVSCEKLYPVYAECRRGSLVEHRFGRPPGSPGRLTRLRVVRCRTVR